MMLRNILRETVCMRLLIAFIIGILAYEILHENINGYIIIFILGILILLTFIYISKFINRYNFTFKIYNGFIVFSICALFGFSISIFQDNRNFKVYEDLLNEKTHTVKVITQGKLTSKNCIYEVEIQTNKFIIAYSILYIEDSLISYHIGDILVINSKLKPIDFINHPNQFDYKTYLARKHIYHRFQIKPNEIVSFLNQSDFNFNSFCNAQRNKLLGILRKNIHDDNSYEMSAALLLGERSDLDPELLKSYSDTGTIHIISVSGLHVGIIFIVLQFVFRRIPFLKSKIANCIAILICIWFYSTLTGLPASVIRSALMISFSSIGKAMSNRSNSINHVAGSALAILTYNTNYLFDIGFQLSYLAVLGIMYLQKPISELYYPNNFLMNYIWETTSVSVAAQLFTLPLCWYYFHQFPNYFLLANLIAIPLSSIALYACIANVVFASIPYLNQLSEIVLVYSIKCMNIYLMQLSKIPFAVSKMEKIGLIELFTVSMFICFFLLYWKEEIKTSLKYGIICLIFLSTYRIINRNNHLHQHLWLIPQQMNMFIVLEDEYELHHFYSNKTREITIQKQHKLWSSYIDKPNRISIVNHTKFRVIIDSSTYFSNKYELNHLGNNYKRICLK